MTICRLRGISQNQSVYQHWLFVLMWPSLIYWRIVARNSLASRFKNPQRRSQVWFTDIRVVLVARSCMRGIGPQIERDSVESIIFGTSNPKSKFFMKCSNSRSVGVHGVVVGTSDRKSSHHKFQFWRGSFQTQIRTLPLSSWFLG